MEQNTRRSYTAVDMCWLSRSKVFHTVCEITEQVDILLGDSNTSDDDDANLCDDEDFIQKCPVVPAMKQKLTKYFSSTILMLAGTVFIVL